MRLPQAFHFGYERDHVNVFRQHDLRPDLEVSPFGPNRAVGRAAYRDGRG